MIMKNTNFDIHHLKALKIGLKDMLTEVGVDATVKIVKTSAASNSLYIHFNDRVARPVRISTHEPTAVQKAIFINIFIK